MVCSNSIFEEENDKDKEEEEIDEEEDDDLILEVLSRKQLYIHTITARGVGPSIPRVSIMVLICSRTTSAFSGDIWAHRDRTEFLLIGLTLENATRRRR